MGGLWRFRSEEFIRLLEDHAVRATGPSARLVSGEIRMLVFLFFGQGDFQIDFCSRLLRTSNVRSLFGFFCLFFSLFQAALNSERHPRLYTAPAGVRVQRTRQGCGFSVKPDSHWLVGWFPWHPWPKTGFFQTPMSPHGSGRGRVGGV